MKVWLATLLLAAGTATADTRALTQRTDILGWEAVGRVDIGESGFCSGALISPRYVLTAGHCVFDDDGIRLDVTQMTFHAGYRDGEVIAAEPITRAAVLPDYDPLDGNYERFLASDVALLELANPIPATTASFYPVASIPPEGHRVTAVSFGRGRANALTREEGCQVMVRVRGLAAFTCKGVPGSSGAPIFDTSGRSPRIVGLISGGGRQNGREAVYGMELTGVVKRLKRGFRTGQGVWPEQEFESRRVNNAGKRSAGSARFLRP